MRPMTQTSDVILERMMALHPKVIDLTLDRVWRLLAAMDHPENRLPPVIHIAGTNGKGSTQAMFRAGLEAAGDTVHAYTSPHLARFHERIRLAGELITEAALTDVLDRCYVANGPDPITYFEITTVAGLVAMAETPADWTLLEVGLGGRLDATNVVAKPALTVITPIDLDHQQFLGDTLAAIATEKAGIMKPGVPCVVARQKPEALDVIDAVAERVGAPLMVQGRDWDVWSERDGVTFQDETGLVMLPQPVLPGAHQVQNAGMVLAGLRHLLGPEHSDSLEAAEQAAMVKAEWPARMQRLTEGHYVDLAGTAELWLDGGHNPAAGEALAATLKSLPDKPTHLICGMLNTKDIRGYLKPLAAVSESLIAVSIPGEVNTIPAAQTADMAQDVGMVSNTADSVDNAIKAIISDTPNARILICGSLYLAGNVLRNNEK